MRRFWTVLIAVLIVATAAWGAPAGSASASKNSGLAKRSFAGHWTLVINGHCAATLQNQNICGLLLLQYDITVVPGTVFNLQNTRYFTVDARNHYTAHGVIIYTERAPKVPHSRCNLNSMHSGDFTGTCRAQVRNTGYVAKGANTTFPDFWFTSDHRKWDDSNATLQDEQLDVDAQYPAVPGTYNTKRYLVAYGYLKANAHIPTGVTIRVTVSRAP